jgi:transcriptional regulator with XRE-family HTH domain
MKLSAYLEKEKLTDDAFAARVKRDRSTIYRIRNGTHKPSPDLMAEIARETNGLVQPNDYFDDLPEAEAA